LGAAAPAVKADVALPPYYEAVMKLSPDGQLGQVVKREKVKTSIAGAQAWRIAYISSDAQERKTLSTALVVAPVGPAPKEGRAMIAWAHGTTGTARVGREVVRRRGRDQRDALLAQEVVAGELHREIASEAKQLGARSLRIGGRPFPPRAASHGRLGGVVT
jgi:hypothetical protein